MTAALEDLNERAETLEAYARATQANVRNLVYELGALADRVAKLEAAATVAVPILGSVQWDTGAIRWTRGATPNGWRKVWTP